MFKKVEHLNLPMTILTKGKKDEIVDYFLSTREMKVGQIARELGVSKGLVSLVFDDLVSLGVIRDGRIDQNKAKIVKLVLNLRKLLEMDFDKLLKKYKLRSIGVFGSYMKGEDKPESDVDIWILADRRIPQRGLASIRKELQKMFGRDVDILVISKEVLSEMRKKNSPLFYDIIHSVVLAGDTIA